MSMQGRDPREDEVMRALATYLEILESGGDGEAFLRRHTEMETELRVLAGIDAGLRVRVPEALFAGKDAVRRKFQAAIREDQTTARALAWFKPRLFGIIGAIGVGAGLTGAFASGALPSEPISNIIGSLPVVGNAFSAPSTPLEQLGNPADGHRLEPLQEQAAPFNEHRPSDPGHPIDDAPASDSESRLIETGPSESPNAGAEGLPGNAEPPAPAAREVDARSNGVGTDGTPPGQGGENPGNGDENGRGIGPDGTPPGQGGEIPGDGIGPDGTPPGQGGEIPGEGVGPDGTPPGQGGEIPGEGVGPDGTPPGQGGEIPGDGDDNGSGVGPTGTPPGQGGEIPGGGDDNGNGVGPTATPPGQGGQNPGNGNENGVGSTGTPPGQGGESPGNGIGPDGTPPGQGGENPGNGVGPDGTPPGQGGENPGNGNSNGVGNRGTPPGHGGENPSNDGGIGIAATPPDQAENGAPGNSQSEGARVADGR